MRIAHSAVPRLRLMTVLTFIGLCALMFGYLWVNMGGRLPVVSSDGYRVAFESADLDNLVYDSDVMVAGVRVGKVRELTVDEGTARVELQIDDDSVMPLHEGARIVLRSKSLIEETYVEIVDGDGDQISDGSTLPASAVQKSVQLDDVLASLDKPTRTELGALLKDLGTATSQTGEQLDRTLTGLGALGREGHDVLDALEAQSQDLRTLVASSTKVMSALDTGEGRIVDLVGEADTLTGATALEQQQIKDTMRALPGVLASARTATGSLSDLSTDLRPVAVGLRQAAPSLNRALLQLPATTRDLRALLPSLDQTLDRAPATLRRVPETARVASDMVPTTRATLADVNPMLAYLNPYGPDLAGFMAGWSAMLGNSDVNGHYLRIFPVVNEGTIKGNPIPLNTSVMDKSNAYPEPGAARNPGPFTGTYPRVERDPE
jgi:phospholipid/cholesterol/gamma-HCH transport system substrate-binding protein